MSVYSNLFFYHLNDPVFQIQNSENNSHTQPVGHKEKSKKMKEIAERKELWGKEDF